MKGYKLWKTEDSKFGKTDYYQRRVDTDDGFDYPLCQCNDKVFINIEVWTYINISCTISLVHENKDGQWCDFKIYSLSEHELWDNIDKFENKLLAMWSLFNE